MMKSKLVVGALVALAVTGIAVWLVAGPGQPNIALPNTGLPNTGDALSAAATRDVAEPNRDAIVHLTDEKRKVAKIRTALVGRQSLRLSRTLPARFAYDDMRHVSVRSPSEGVLEAVLVKPGDAVSQGQTLARLRSPTIGDARSRILTSESTLELAAKALQWQTSLQMGVDQLTQSIRAGVSPEAIRDTLRDQVLGDLGGQLLQQYSRSDLANRLALSVGSVAESGAISGRVIRERTSTQQQAQAELDASIEQTLFQAKQSRDTAEAAVEAAKRDLQIATQSLSTLLGATAFTTEELDVSPNDPDLSRLTIRSPLAGTVESRVYSASERVTSQSDLFVIADTSILWVEADIRSRDWDSIAVTAGDTVMVSTPSIPGPPQAATVYFLGREVDPASGALPLVAQIDNAKGNFRPGLFARVAVPIATFDDVIAIPESAVVDLDGQPTVFIERDGAFVPISVTLGHANDSQVEIRSGLDVDQSIVVNGAFLLKSELLLGEGE